MGEAEKKNSKWLTVKKPTLEICLIALGIGLIVFLFTNKVLMTVKRDNLLSKATYWLTNNVYKVINSIDYAITDYMFQPDGNTELPITIIGIDDKMTALHGYANTWSREISAQLIEKLCTDEYEPAVIAFDILYTSDKDSEGDQRFADVCNDYGSVVAGMYLNYDTIVNNETHVPEEIVSSILYPYDALKNAVYMGFTNNGIDDDGFFRNLKTHDSYNGEVFYPFSLAAYKIYAEKNGIDVREFSDKEKQFMFRYSTKSGRSGIQVFDMSAVLYGDDDEDPDHWAKLLDGSIVLVGQYSIGFGDDFRTPADKSTTMYGVQIHANEIEAFHQDKLIRSASDIAVSIIYGLIAACLVLCAYVFSLPIACAITAFTGIADFIICIIMYNKGVYLKIAFLLIPVIITLATTIIMHYLTARADKAKINNAFKMYVAPEIVDEMASDGKFEMKLGGQTKDIAVLFIDIRGFTTMSEKLPPEEVVSILNEYFGLVTDAIFKNKGTIDKFVGDAAMAVFNSPNDLDDYVYRAVHTGWDILLGTHELLEKLEATHHRTIGFGIGVNCGPATVGNIGSSFRMDYTAIGDTVNTSARLEANAAAGQILISQDVLDRVSEWVEVEKVEGIKLKGKSNEFNIYNITKVIDKPGYLETGISKKHR